MSNNSPRVVGMDAQRSKTFVWLLRVGEGVAGFCLALILVFACAVLLLQVIGADNPQWGQRWAELAGREKVLLSSIGLIPVVVVALLLGKRRKALTVGMIGYIVVDIVTVLMDG